VLVKDVQDDEKEESGYSDNAYESDEPLADPVNFNEPVHETEETPR
jgi:hypothetical protein